MPTVRYERVMSDNVEEASAADMRTQLEQAEADAAEAEAAAVAARARVRKMRTEAEEGDEEPLPPQPQPPRPWWPLVAKTIAVIVILSALVLSGLILWQHHGVSDKRQLANEYIEAAGHGAVALTSMDFNHAKEDVQRVIDISTGSFRDDYVARADDFVKVVQASNVVAKGTVKAAAIEKIDDNSGVVLVVIEGQVTNSAGAKNDPRLFRMRVTVARDGDQLKMSNVDWVP